MRCRVLALLFVSAVILLAQTMTVKQLTQFFESEAAMGAQKHSDKDMADVLRHARMGERLDAQTFESLRRRFVPGPKTLAALETLRDQSRSLPAPGTGERASAETGRAMLPVPSAEEQAAILADVRQYALNYSRTLPDFICTEVTRRYAAPSKSAGDVDWRPLDMLTERLSYYEQHEDYKLIMHNTSVASNQDPKSAGGAQSFGDFGSMLKQIFEPATQAKFEWAHWHKIDGQNVMEFAYRVSQEKSQYRLIVDNDRNVITAYHGIVVVDPNTHAVLRVSVIADNIPSSFPIQSAEDVLEYGYQDISGQKFLLPLRVTMTMNVGDHLTRNDNEFRIYRKYSADAVLKYDMEEAPTAAGDQRPPTTKK